MSDDWQTRTGDQRDLFGAQSGREAWLEFHERNPHVYGEIVALARHARELGRDRWSINGIFEVLRWNRLVTHGDPFKLNNNLRAHYAREVMAREPDLAGFFETRRVST